MKEKTVRSLFNFAHETTVEIKVSFSVCPCRRVSGTCEMPTSCVKRTDCHCRFNEELKRWLILFDLMCFALSGGCLASSVTSHWSHASEKARDSKRPRRTQTAKREKFITLSVNLQTRKETTHGLRLLRTPLQRTQRLSNDARWKHTVHGRVVDVVHAAQTLQNCGTQCYKLLGFLDSEGNLVVLSE